MHKIPFAHWIAVLTLSLFLALGSGCSDNGGEAGPNAEPKVEVKEAQPLEWTSVTGWLKLPEGLETMGAQHGDIAVSENGDVYVSLTGGLRAGVQIYDANGNYVKNLEGAPNDFHGFVIHKDSEGVEYIYGPRLGAGEILKLTLEGELVMKIPGDAIPKEHWKVHPKSKKAAIRLTACDVAPNGDIFVTDGYSSDLIHRFNSKGEYQATFGGKGEPFGFQTLHKIAVDTRFDPARIVGVSRTDGRVVHLSMDGEWIGDVATDLLMPAALVVFDDLLAVGEIKGRVTFLDKEGNIVKHVGANDHLDQSPSNKVEPADWKPGVLNAPHGVAFNSDGDLFVAEYSVFGRV